MRQLLDLYCGEGGAAIGYARAGFDVTGVDNRRAVGRYYPGRFVHADALEYLAAHGHDFDVIHASPPCQRYTHGNVAGNQSAKWPDLIGATRDELENSGRPYVIENVPRAPLCRPLVLCGTMFNLATLDADGTLLHLRRHRLFESNIPLAPPRPCAHVRGAQWAGAYGGARHDKHDARLVRRGGYVPDPERQARLLGAYPWRGTLHGLQESIPPAYAEWVGRQLRAAR